MIWNTSNTWIIQFGTCRVVLRRDSFLICTTSVLHTRHEGEGGGSRRSRLLSAFTPRIWRPQASNERGPKMNTASTFVDSAFTRTAIFQEGNSSEALPSTHRILKAISPSVKWLKPSPAEQLPAFSECPPPTPLLHHCPAQSQPLSGSPLPPE